MIQCFRLDLVNVHLNLVNQYAKLLYGTKHINTITHLMIYDKNETVIYNYIICN